MVARNNPYRTACIESLSYDFIQGSWDELLQRLNRNAYRGSIVGPHGSGKTTLLEQLAHRLKDQGFRILLHRCRSEELPAGRSTIRRLLEHADNRTILMLDSAGLLRWTGWMELLINRRRLEGLIVTAHRWMPLPVLHKTRVTPELFDRLNLKLCPESRPLEGSAALLKAVRGDVREAFRRLYFQAREQ